MSEHPFHHITAITAHPQANLDFYEGFLGQRLVKQTVNFDDPRSYHFYFGDTTGTPGTLLTFFYFGPISLRQPGSGEVSAIAYRIQPASLDFWRQRASEFEIAVDDAESAFGQKMVRLHDPDGITIELVADETAQDYPYWSASPVPAEHSLCGFAGVRMVVSDQTAMQPLLHHLGYSETQTAGAVTRYHLAQVPSTYLELESQPSLQPARQGSGSVHHLAFRASDDNQEIKLQRAVRALGLQTTPVIDRQYFHSVYFQTPAGVLFEIATDQPGFGVDEEMSALGEKLVLPPQLEPYRAEIVKQLVPITLPRHR